MGWLRILFYVGGRIVTALLAGFGLAYDYTGASVLTISPSNWGLIGLVAFVAFLVITVIREIDLQWQPRPRLQFDEPSPATAPVTARSGAGSALIGQGYFTRLGFKNKAKNPSSNSTAQHTTGHITIFDAKNAMVDDWEGRWANKDEPTQVTEIWRSNQYDIEANNQQAILDIGFRLQGQIGFQGWDNFHYLAIQQARQQLGAGNYTVKVRLAPSNDSAKDFWFSLTMPNQAQTNDLNQVKIVQIKKPVSHKKGY